MHSHCRGVDSVWHLKTPGSSKSAVTFWTDLLMSNTRSNLADPVSVLLVPVLVLLLLLAFVLVSVGCRMYTRKFFGAVLVAEESTWQISK